MPPGIYKHKKWSEERRKKHSLIFKKLFREGKVLLPNQIGENNPMWRGGRIQLKDGYILIYQPQHPYPNHAKKYVFEHRLVMEKKLGRYLNKKEIVHHINGIRNDNKIENLIVMERGVHTKYHMPNGPMIGRKHSKETKEQYSKIRKGKKFGPMSNERKKKISESKKGIIPWNKGLHMKQI